MGFVIIYFLDILRFVALDLSSINTSLVWVGVCLFVSNNVKTAGSIGPKLFVGPHGTQERFKNLPLTKFHFKNFGKSTKFFLLNPRIVLLFLFYNVYKESMFIIEIKDLLPSRTLKLVSKTHKTIFFNENPV